MAFAKRIVLFLALNFIVVGTITAILNILHVEPYLSAHGLNYSALMTFCLIWGFGGALISLGLSRQMAKWMMGVRVVDPSTNDPELRELVETVHRLARAAHLPWMPEVGIYDSPDVNAFATGPSRKRSLVAVSTALLRRMSKEELEGVLGHEIAHIANGDMVTMTLLQGVVNAFVMFLARVLAYLVAGLGQKNRSSSGSYASYTIFVFIFQTVFMVLGWMIIAAYSRFREFRADQGGAQLAGKGSMISALQALQRVQQVGTQDVPAEKPAFQTMKISNAQAHGGGRGVKSLFATHPPLEVRIERLQNSE